MATAPLVAKSNVVLCLRIPQQFFSLTLNLFLLHSGRVTRVRRRDERSVTGYNGLIPGLSGSSLGRSRCGLSDLTALTSMASKMDTIGGVWGCTRGLLRLAQDLDPCVQRSSGGVRGRLPS